MIVLTKIEIHFEHPIGIERLQEVADAVNKTVGGIVPIKYAVMPIIDEYEIEVRAQTGAKDE